MWYFYVGTVLAIGFMFIGEKHLEDTGGFKIPPNMRLFVYLMVIVAWPGIVLGVIFAKTDDG